MLGADVGTSPTGPWAVAACLAQCLNDEGVGSLITATGAERRQWRSALATLSTPPTNTMLSEALTEKVFRALQPTLKRFAQEMLREDVSVGEQIATLNCLYEEYMTVQAMLEEWAQALGVPSAGGSLAVFVRSALLQPDVLTGEEPLAKAPLLQFLTQHGYRLLQSYPTAAENEEDDGVNEQVSSIQLFGNIGRFRSVAEDPVLRCLHGLSLSATREIRNLWRSVVDDCIAEKMATLEENYSEHRIDHYLQWEEQVVEPFMRAALSAESSGCRHGEDTTARSVKDQWCAEFKQKLLASYVRKRISTFWDILVEFPDSVAALEDVQYCLRSNTDGSLKEELLTHLRGLLSARLHRAGTRTEDILVILSKAIHSLAVLLSRNEQSTVVFSIVADTLNHLRRRRDCVAAVVQSLTQSGTESLFHHDLSTARVAVATSRARDTDSTEEADFKGAVRESPDVLRILLTAIPVKSLTHEYQCALATQLLSKSMHTFDTTTEEEVLERVKCVLGEDVLQNCAVMVHDIQTSKRITHQIRECIRSKPLPSLLPPEAVSLDILSITAWPRLSHCPPAGEQTPVPEKYTPHPILQREMKVLAARFGSLKVGQKLTWILSHGRTTLELDMQDPARQNALVTVPFTLSIFAASAVLYIVDLEVARSWAESRAQGIPVKVLAAMFGVPAATVASHLQPLVPSLFCLTEDNTWIAVQHSLATTANVIFEESTDQGDAAWGLSPEQTQLMERMITAMLKTRGAVSLQDIYNSMKMFAQFSGTVTDMKKLLGSFVAKGNLVLTDAKLYALPS